MKARMEVAVGLKECSGCQNGGGGLHLYQIFSWITNWVGGPLSNVAYASKIGFLSVFFLGAVGSVAPCQISANMGAIMYFGNRQLQQRLSSIEITMYLLGKITVFSVLGLLFWVFGQTLSNELIPFFSILRKFLGPYLILMGCFLMGWVRLPGNLGFSLSRKLQHVAEHSRGRWGAFLLGASFSLGFCPTMFWLFFGMVMPMVISSSYGFVLPPVFAIGTAIPFLLFAGFIILFGLDTVMIKRSKRWGRWIQKIVGILLIFLGVADTVTFWL